MGKVFLLLGAAAASFFLFVLPDIDGVVHYFARRDWIVIPARISDIHCQEIERSVAKKRFRTTIIYTYTFGENQYKGNERESNSDVLPSGDDTTSLRQVKLRYYPIGRIMKAEVNPRNPQESVLTDVRQRSLYSVLIGSILFFLFVLLALRAYRKQKQQKGSS